MADSGENCPLFPGELPQNVLEGEGLRAPPLTPTKCLAWGTPFCWPLSQGRAHPTLLLLGPQGRGSGERRRVGVEMGRVGAGWECVSPLY